MLRGKYSIAGHIHLRFPWQLWLPRNGIKAASDHEQSTCCFSLGFPVRYVIACFLEHQLQRVVHSPGQACPCLYRLCLMIIEKAIYVTDFLD